MNWLLLRGLAREQRHWGRFPDVFAKKVGVTVHALDFPGTGTEHARRGPASVAAIVEDLRARWEPLRARSSGPWGLLGISLGGMVTMQWAAAHPEDFSRVVIANTSGRNLSLPWKRMRWGVLPSIVRALVERDPVARERRILGATTKLVPNPDEVAQAWSKLMLERPIARATVLRQLFAATSFRAPATLSMPVLVLGGAKDALTDPSCPRLLARHFHAPLEVHPGAGHDLSLDAPEWIADRVRDWIAAPAPVAVSA